jgi:hypothetical protein
MTACPIWMAGCPQQQEGGTMITKDQAMEIARKEFSKHGHTVSDYDVTVETYYADERQWMVWFEKKGPFPIPGGSHAVLVHRTTGQPSFMPGE